MPSKNQNEEEDFLSEDPILPGQRYCIISFLSPEKVLKDKHLYFVEEFVKDYDIQWRTKYLEKYVADTCNAFNSKIDEFAKKFDASGNQEMVEMCRNSRLRTDQFIMEYQAVLEKNRKELKYSNVDNAWKDFMFKNKAQLEDKFFAANDFHTTVRGVKMRGAYDTAKESTMRAERLRKKFPYDNFYIGEVGKWLPWDPEPHEIAEQDYGNEKLNQLMKRYNENEEKLDEFYSARNLDRPDKKIHGIDGAEEGAAAPDNVSDALFGTTGDLAISRKTMGKEIKIVVDDAPVGDAPVGDAPVGDAPVGDAPAGDAPVGDSEKPKTD
jgi:hypothetical protein